MQPDPPAPARKVTAMLTLPAAQALDSTVVRTGHTATDTINRALLIYNQITQALETGQPQRLTIRETDGQEVGVLLVATADAARPFWLARARRRVFGRSF